MPDLQDVHRDVLDERTETTDITRSQVSSERACHACGEALEAETVECPGCGAINLDRARKRKEKNRPTRDAVQEIVSGNHNGKYIIFRNSDGSLSCTCYSFLFQRGIENSVGYSTCKHIRDYLSRNPAPHAVIAERFSPWQEVALKRFGVEVNSHLTDAQAYFVFRDLLAKQGVRYREYENLLRNYGEVNLLPVYAFGAEFEGMVRGTKEQFRDALAEAGIEADISGYSTALSNHWMLASDSTIQRIPDGFTGVELKTPKLFGSGGFGILRKALLVWNNLGSIVNASCGTHVHIDAWNWDERHMVELSKIWAKIEQKVIWFLVSPSRRNNRYCTRIDRNYIVGLAGNGSIILDRYSSLNLSAFHRHRTIEFRIHNSTTDTRKIIPWIIFLLKLTDAVKKGLTHRDIEPSIEGVFDALGMGNSATSVIRHARQYLINRHNYWKEDAERNPSRMPEQVEIDLEGIDEEVRNISIREHYQRNRWNRISERNDSLPDNSVQNLASLRSQTYMPVEHVGNAVSGDPPWEVPARNGNRTFTVSLNQEDDTLTCICRNFRSHRRCYHTMNVARYLVAMRQEVR